MTRRGVAITDAMPAPKHAGRIGTKGASHEKNHTHRTADLLSGLLYRNLSESKGAGLENHLDRRKHDLHEKGENIMKTLLVIAAFVVLACVIVALCEAIASMFSTDKDAGVIMPDDYRALKNDTKEGRVMKILKIYDNGGETFDRYTVYYDAFTDSKAARFHHCRCMSEHPCHPHGFGQYSDGTIGPHNGKEISFDDLPQECRDLVARDLAG